MTPLLTWQSVTYRYPGVDQPALRDASLQVVDGSRMALLGRNGSGKSTLLLHGNGLLKPDQGTVSVAGTPMQYDRHGLRQARQVVGLIFQQPNDQLFSASVAQDISFGPLNLGLDQAEVRRRVQAAAELCEIGDVLDRPTHALSGGQKARVALAGVLAMEPQVVLADEVTANLDPWMCQQVFTIFNRIVAEGRAVVLATHDLDIARHWADQVTVMAHGSVIAVGTPDVILGDPALRDLLGPSAPWGVAVHK